MARDTEQEGRLLDFGFGTIGGLCSGFGRSEGNPMHGVASILRSPASYGAYALSSNVPTSSARLECRNRRIYLYAASHLHSSRWLAQKFSNLHRSSTTFIRLRLPSTTLVVNMGEYPRSEQSNGHSSPNPGHDIFKVSNPWRDRILRGEVCSVMSCKYAVSNEMAMMARIAGIDGMFIDTEHSVLTIREVSQLVTACNYVGVSPIVRIPCKAHWHLSRILDAGAAAVVIPHCETVEEVRQIVKDAKYAPLGRRGCSNNQPILNFQSVPTLKQNELLNRDTMVIPMIETPGAVDLVDEFLSIDGVDGILIGSNDLCTDLGIPGQYDNPIYQDNVSKVVRACIGAGKPVGIGGIGGRLDLLEMWFKMGATWSLSGADGAMLQAGMQRLGKVYGEINERVLLERKECSKR